MSKYKSLVTKSFEFDGDTVTVNLRRMKRGDFLSLLPVISGMQGDDNDTEANFKLVDAACEILPDYIDSITGVTDADDNLVEINTILNDTYFIELVAEIIGFWIESSMVTNGKK